jgi:NAD(P)-dependent dehydrogenase (short-subunit alcohol dehydrogenase family)
MASQRGSFFLLFIFFHFSGIMLGGGTAKSGLELHSAAQWDKIWHVNVASHVYAFQALLPHFRRNQGG